MTDRPALSRAELMAALLSLGEPAVAVHKNPDGDAVGSAVALVRYLRAHGVAATLLTPDPIPARLLFLCEGVPMCEDPAPREIVTVDVASLAQAGRLAPAVEAAERVYMIDHHALATPFAPHYIKSEASAVGEVLYDLFSEGGRVPLTPEVAAPLYAAIASDTGSFRFNNTTAAAHLAAAHLLAAGIPSADICRRLFDVREGGELSAIAYAINHTREYEDGRLSILAVPRRALGYAGCAEGDFDGVIDTVRSRKGVEVAAVIRERADGTVRLSLRSTGRDVATLCASFGGGGHRLAAGCTLPVENAEAGEALLLTRISSLFKENR